MTEREWESKSLDLLCDVHALCSGPPPMEEEYGNWLDLLNELSERSHALLVSLGEDYELTGS